MTFLFFIIFSAISYLFFTRKISSYVFLKIALALLSGILMAEVAVHLIYWIALAGKAEIR